MSLVEARERHERLMNPPNAVVDHGIDLRRKEKMPVIPIAEIKVQATAVFLPPYGIGSIVPHYRLSYIPPYRDYTGTIRVKDIQRAVCDRCDVKMAEMLSNRRTANVVRPRHMAMYLVKTLTVRSLPDIGKRFGGRDHTTVLSAVRKITRERQTDPVLSAKLDEIAALFLGAPHD